MTQYKPSVAAGSGASGSTNALCLMSRSPHRLSDGWSIRSWHLVEALTRCADAVHVVFFGLPEEVKACQEAFGAQVAGVHAVAPPPPYRPWALLKGLFLPTPFNMHNLWSRAMAGLLEQLSARIPFDAVQIEDICMAQYARFIAKPNTAGQNRTQRLVLDMHNVDSQLMARYGEQETSLSKSLYARLTAAKLKASERAYCNAFDAVLTCSKQDADLLGVHTSPKRLQIVPNGVHRGYFAPDTTFPGTDSLVFTGSLDYHANVSGVLWFLEEVFPRIRELRPKATMNIVGKNPVQAVIQAAQETPGVTLNASVPDVRPYMRQADVVVVPLLVGGGTRLKILEALSLGRPIVSTSLGCEGIGVRHERDILIADAPEDFAQSVVRVLADRNLQQSLVTAGFETVRDYDWQTIGEGVRQLYVQMGLQKAQAV